MSDEPQPTQSRYSLASALERQAGNLAGKVRKKALQFIDDKNICSTCRYAHIMRRGSQNSVIIFCDNVSGYDNGRVPSDLTECNKYRNITELSLEQMADIATLLDQRDLMKDSYL
jgi:hypothetical protein